MKRKSIQGLLALSLDGLLTSSLVSAQETTFTRTITQDASETQTQTFTAPVESPTVSDTYTDSQRFRDDMMNATNYYRYLHSAAFVSYNESLASYAADYSRECQWRHNPDLSSSGLGENLARGYANVSASVFAWYDEVNEFDYDFDRDSPTGFTEETGHFTQLVWRETQAVGCGWTDCEGRNGVDGVLVVCNYWPAGNVLGPSGSGEDRFFVDNVLPERDGEGEGFNEQDAIRGVRTDVPDPNAQGNNGDNGDEDAAASLKGGVWKVLALTTAVLGWALF
ncbi:uncharacterized protein HMPREF1541_06949 [Cyphellophora europaea CBS 101466]|uniref:SCP domain-containing protein n=1 Tax=Cyphellophora europaea (strain CBS 101466) TaxID=1220924 RepID=W2RR39_CYPE1|nr:uncharacterized protein HMPREF1541_06949 [Cyphellophora europaea CBS 101466]ETN38907.1 hypothetical protein HMPREF1541_06949 [Cyphellophora europaea CBS 101466]